MNFIPVQPVGTYRDMVHLNFGGGHSEWREMGMPEYPPSEKGQKLREFRLKLNLGLRQASAVLGVGASELSGLEQGRLTLGSDDEWRELARKLLAASPPPPRPACRGKGVA